MMRKRVRTQVMTQHHEMHSSGSALAHSSRDVDGTEESPVCSVAC
jgi:hypothetical protein